MASTAKKTTQSKAKKTTKAKPKAASKVKKKAVKTAQKTAPAAKKKAAAPKKKTVASKAKPKVAKKKVAPKRAATKATKKATKKAVKKTVKTVAKPAVKAAATAQKMSSATQNTMEKAMTQSTKQFEKITQDANELSREGIEAYIKSSTIFAKGFEDMFRTGMALVQSAAESQAQLTKEAMSSKTLNEWAEVQNKIAKANFDEFMAGATKISELGVKVLSEASEPINAQMSKTIKKANAAVAA